MVTREEKHTTRGRARLLFEMLEGDPLDAKWRADEIHDALDLCLACKGCKGECPVHVDMATYKAEFLAHYYEHHRRPRSAMAFGHIGTWARLVARLRAQRVVNTVVQTPGVRTLVKWGAGMASPRTVPAFAPRTFRTWFNERRPQTSQTGGRLLLWPDTFNDHFHPETLIAAVGVLERLGFEVLIPRAPLCCGRPLYDFGLLSLAKRRLSEIMASLGDEIRAGTPIVGLEPGCVSVFRDELVNLFPSSEQAHRLKTQTFTLAEWLDRYADRLAPFRLERQAVVHAHCHHKAIMNTDADRRVLDRLGLRYEMLDSGCCGMAGAFGFEAEHYDVSMAVGERVLLPAVRAADQDTLILADGFSCREQIAQTTRRRALHLADVVHLAMNRGVDAGSEQFPERAYVADHSAAQLTVRELVGVGLMLGGLALATLVGRAGRH